MPAYKIEKQDYGRIQCNGSVCRDIFKIEDCGAPGIGDVAVRRISDAFGCEEVIVQGSSHIFLIVSTFLNQCKIGITFGICIGDQVVGDAVGKGSGSDAGTTAERREVLRMQPGGQRQEN